MKEIFFNKGISISTLECFINENKVVIITLENIEFFDVGHILKYYKIHYFVKEAIQKECFYNNIERIENDE